MPKGTTYSNEKKNEAMRKFKELRALLPHYTHFYLDSMVADYQPNTIVAYARDLITFFKYLKEAVPMLKELETKDVPLDIIENLTAMDILEYKNYLLHNDGENKHSNQASSVERRMAPLRGLCGVLFDTGAISSNPTAYSASRRRRRADKREVVYLENEEVQSLLETVETSKVASERQQKFATKTQLRDSAIITLLLNTGMRVSELVGIDLSDLNFEDGSVRIVRKGGAEQLVYFGDRVAAALHDYIELERAGYAKDGEPALFLSLQKSRMTVRAVEYMVKKFAREAVPNKRISPHKMRSTYGTALYEKTSDIRLVADVLGHEDVTTTARHYASVKEKNRKAAGQIKPYED